ncbi:(+)-borneol dehydrogenase 2-like protein [Drosera capensis]
MHRSIIAARAVQRWRRISSGQSLIDRRRFGDRSMSSVEGTENKLSGKVAMVTGGAMGIGESIVRLFHKHGAKVCIVDVEDVAGEKLSQSLGDKTDICFIRGDVTVEDNISHAVDFTVDRFGKLDIFVNNAGLAGHPYSDIRDVDLSDFSKVFDVNARGVFLGMKHAARIMIPEKKGVIVSICSVSSVMGGMASHAYTGSKHAILGLTRSVAAELGKHGVRVNCVSPYAVPTRLSMPYLPEDERSEDILAGFQEFTGSVANLKGVHLTREDVAKSVLFLASDDARYISGANLMVDGGLTVTNHSLRVFG